MLSLPRGWRLTKTSPTQTPSAVRPAYIAMCALDQKESSVVELLWSQPSQKTANSVATDSRTVTLSSHGSVCGRPSAFRAWSALLRAVVSCDIVSVPSGAYRPIPGTPPELICRSSQALAANSQSVSESSASLWRIIRIRYANADSAGDRRERDLDAEHALLGPVHVVELEQQRGLVEHERDADAEREREVLVELLALGADRDAARGEREDAAGEEVVDVAVADLDVLDRAEAAVLADRPRDRAGDAERDRERREHVEQRVLARAADRVALAQRDHRLDRLGAPLVLGGDLAAARERAEAPHAGELGAEDGDHGAAGEDAEHVGAAAGCRSGLFGRLRRLALRGDTRLASLRR